MQRIATCPAARAEFSRILSVMDQPPHIMVVDDDREIRDLLARFLEKHRIRVTAVRDARDARRAWAERPLPACRARPDAAGRAGPRLRPLAAQPVRRADRHADRHGRGDRPHHRPGTRRRRLRAQAVQPARIAGPHPRRAAPRRRRAAEPRHDGGAAAVPLRRLDAGAGAPPPAQPRRRRGRR